MGDHQSHQGPGPSRKFVPDVNPLESRFLLSGSDPRGGSTGGDDLPRFLPRTGGVSVQTGSELGIGVGQPTKNTVQVTDVHTGNVQAQWNGGPLHTFMGVTTDFIEAERARHDRVTFNLTAPRTGPTAVAVGSQVRTGALPASEERLHLNVGSSRRTSGSARQSGSVLTVTVDRPKSNLVQITNAGEGNVQVEWNGGKSQSFAGVEIIVVNARNARKDDIILTDSSS
jgi:hypothetical protein